MSDEQANRTATEWMHNRLANGDLDENQQAALRQYVANGGDYPHQFAVPDKSVYDLVEECMPFCPPGWTVRGLVWGRGIKKLPKGSFRIGQYRARSGDPTNPIYMVPDEE